MRVTTPMAGTTLSLTMSSRNKIMRRPKQRPDQNFLGTEHLLDQRIDQAGPRAIGETCDPAAWSDVFEIPVCELGTSVRNTHVSADLGFTKLQPELCPQRASHSTKGIRGFPPLHRLNVVRNAATWGLTSACSRRAAGSILLAAEARSLTN